MNLRSIPLLLVLALTGALVALNWNALSAPSTLSLGVRTVQAPLGLVMLGLMGLLGLAFLVYALSLQGKLIFDARRQARELQAQRELADKAEASRFTELREFVRTEMVRVTQTEDALRRELLDRLDRLEQQSRLLLEQQANSLAASIGELEDRLERHHVLDLRGPDGSRLS